MPRKDRQVDGPSNFSVAIGTASSLQISSVHFRDSPHSALSGGSHQEKIVQV